MGVNTTTPPAMSPRTRPPGPPALPVLPDPATDTIMESGLLEELAYALGGAFHFLLPDSFDRNLQAMRSVLKRTAVEGTVYYAKKANKAAVWIEHCAAAGAGVDISSVGELREALGHGVRGRDVMVTGPAKSRDLLVLAMRHGAVVAVDALDELESLMSVAATGIHGTARLMLRCLPPAQPHSRFGMTGAELATALDRCLQAGDALRMEGFSFHLSGYALRPRADLAALLIAKLGQARARGLQADRISIGGGLPVSYTDAESWSTFLSRQHGDHYHADKAFAADDFYPYHSPVAGAEALRTLLETRPEGHGRTLATLLKESGTELLLEPGRALLDQAGATVFPIQGVKDRPGYRILTVDGTSLSLSEQWFNSEYLPDPHLLPQDPSATSGTHPACVGAATCLESDMLSWRKIPFPRPPRVGDLLVYPNTAGYQMDSNESSFHDLPLPPKVVIDRTDRPRPRWRLDRHFT